MLPFVLAITFAFAPLEVKGDATCPRANDVAVNFAKAKTSERLGEGHRALISTNVNGVVLQLQDEHGAVLGEKLLPTGTCEGLAAAAAAMLVVWETSLPPRHTAIVPPLSRKPVSAPEKPVSAPEGVWNEPDGLALAWRGDVAVTGALSGVTPRPGLFMAVAAGPRDGAWRIFAHAVGTLTFENAVGQGQVRWSRPGFGLGASLRVNDAALRVDVSAALEAAWLLLSANGYEQNFNATAFDPGATVSARLSAALASRVGWFAELSTTAYPLQKTAVIRGTDLRLPIPPFGLALRAGFFFGER